MNSPWKLIFLLVGIFAAGVMSGVFLDQRINFAQPAKIYRSTVAVEQWAPKQLKRLEDGLDLTAVQAEQLRPTIRRSMEELDRLRSYSRSETASIFERMEREINDKLTPDQRVKYEQLNKENRERMKNDPRGGDRPRDGMGPPPPKEGSSLSLPPEKK